MPTNTKDRANYDDYGQIESYLFPDVKSQIGIFLWYLRKSRIIFYKQLILLLLFLLL